MFMKLDNMCTPVVLTFLIITAQLIINLMKTKIMLGIKTFISGLLFTFLLSVLCSYNYTKTAWVIFLIPIFLFIILNILLITIYNRSQEMKDESYNKKIY